MCPMLRSDIGFVPTPFDPTPEGLGSFRAPAFDGRLPYEVGGRHERSLRCSSALPVLKSYSARSLHDRVRDLGYRVRLERFLGGISGEPCRIHSATASSVKKNRL